MTRTGLDDGAAVHAAPLWHHRAVSEPGDVATVPARKAAPPPRRRALLVMIGDAVESRPLPLAGEVAIGRGPGNDVAIDHPSMSRRHLVLRLADDAIEVIDQGGANGTTLRGARLPREVAVEIAGNEPFVAGEVTLVVQDLRALAAGAAPTPRPTGAVAVDRGEPIVLDPEMRRLHQLAARLARGTLSVLLVGETGTGKEMLAEQLHRRSPRGGGPLVRINCAAFADTLVESELFGHERGAFTGAARERRGLLESADGGTVLLDEVGEVPPVIQAKLLRVLEERAVLRVGGTTPQPIDVRFVAATNRDLEAEVEAGRFRRDLYFRLAGAVLAIPPLRERPDEIAALARAFAAEAAGRLGRAAPRVDDGALAALRGHAWTGNVRELRNVIERAVLLSDDDRLTADHLALGGAARGPARPASAVSASVSADPVLADQLAAVERERILAALAECHGNQTRAAALLGMPRRTLVKRLGQYGVPRPRKP